ncbi:MAG: SDR family NAD(P)-dependent oxidoreductase [Hyphomonadaceae bacterium]|nr:SDR family NAD(P)-dependent oxidoreductase [Hyphomonadaceae bacterium]
MKSKDIEFLLGRAAQSLDMGPARSFLRGAVVLVTGAGGSIGSELCRELAAIGCRRIVALDNSDHALIDTTVMLREDFPHIDIQEILCDVRDAQRLSSCFARARPDVVIHAAALKHVHMGDRHPVESVLTNLVGVRNAVEAAAAAKVKRFLLVSSDKAAAPGSVMGACKRLAELYVHTCARVMAARPSPMRLMSVRFGNVFGSAGSVAPVFERQIARGGPVTVTHPDMRRYFMTVQEAVQLILLVCASDREDAASYLLDMGEEVRIMDLAKRMIARANAFVPIVTTGVREGEKLNEQLFDAYEHVEPSHIPGVSRIIPASADIEVTAEDIGDLERTVRALSDDIARHRVFALLDSRLGERASAVG